MKIGDIYHLCKSNYNIIESINLPENKLEDDILILANNVFLCAELKEVECLKDAYENFIQIPSKVVLTLEDISLEEYNNFKEAKFRLLVMMECIIKMYEEAGLQSKAEIGLDIKFPINGNFSDFRKNIDELDFVLTKCPFFQDENESLRFDNVDIGSFWLTFSVVGGVLLGGSILLNNIAAFVDKCMIVRSHYLITEKQKMDLEKAKADQKIKEEIMKSLDNFYKIEIDTAIKELEEITNCKIKDGDDRGRAEQSLEKLGKLLDKGMQLYATIDSPKDTKALFEPLEMHYLQISKKLELLEEKEEQKNDEK